MCQSYTLCVEIMNCTYVDTAYFMLKSEFIFTFTVKNTLDRKNYTSTTFDKYEV